MSKANQQVKKITYMNCEKAGHQQQPLSRICIDQKCKKKTLVCALCEEIEHKKHDTLPLKMYLLKTYGEQQESKDKRKKKQNKNQSTNPAYLINQIDEIYNSFFGIISAYRNQILDKLYTIQTQGKMFFNKIRQQIKYLIRLQNPFQYIQKQRITQARLKQYFLHMTKTIDYYDKEVFDLSTKLEQIVNSCKDKQKKLMQTLSKNSSTLQKQFAKISISLDQNTVFAMKNPTFSWDQSMKGHKVKVNGLIAEQTGMQSSGQRFALIEPSLGIFGGSKKICWGIKVIKFVGWVGIGICLKSQISKANYHFNYGNIGHGSYLISTNGYSWSHSVKQFNSAYKSFQFNVNDTVYVQYDPLSKKLRFKKNKTNEHFVLDIVDPPADDEFCPCANICSNGDTVQIINQSIQFPS